MSDSAKSSHPAGACGAGDCANGKPLKIAIFGCGYLGGRFARLATQAGHEVSALTRNPERAAELRAAGCKNVVESMLNEDGWHSQFNEPHYDLVVNCVSSAGGGMDGYRLSYLDGMRSLAAWAAKGHRVGHFVYTSATSVYPQMNGELVTEQDVPAEHERTPSGQLLMDAEDLVREAAGTAFESATVLRLGAIYGEGRHHLLQQLSLGNTTFIGSGHFILNHIHVDDAVLAIWAAYKRAASGNAPVYAVYNVTDGVHPAKSEVIYWLADQLAVDKESIVFDTESVSARAMRRQVPGFGPGTLPNRRVSVEAITGELGWKPSFTSFREGYTPLISEIKAARSAQGG